MEKGREAMFTHEKISEHITRLRDVSGVCMYLIEGAEKAALVDTGLGLGDLRSYVEGLTAKTITVLLTHGHVDHAMGAGPFETAYINFADRRVYEQHSALEVRKDYLKNGGPPGQVVAVPESGWQEIRPWDAFLPLAVGDVFELGGVSLEICPGAGHTPGCVTILVREERVLILGDAANPFTFLFDMAGGAEEPGSLTVREYLDSLIEMSLATDGRYDRCLFFHGPGEGPTDMLTSVRQVAEDVITGKDDRIPFAAMGRPDLRLAKALDFRTMSRADGGSGNLVYDPARI